MKITRTLTLGLVVSLAALACAGCRTRYQTYSGPTRLLDDVATMFVFKANVWSVDGVTNTPTGECILGKHNLTLLPGEHEIEVLVYPVYYEGSDEATVLTLATNTGVLKAGKGYQVHVIMEDEEVVSDFLTHVFTGTKRVKGRFKVFIKEEKHRSDVIEYSPAGGRAGLQRHFVPERRS